MGLTLTLTRGGLGGGGSGQEFQTLKHGLDGPPPPASLTPAEQ